MGREEHGRAMRCGINKEGWTFLFNSPKWHYFREGRSLCGRFLLLGSPELEKGNDDSVSNYVGCKRKLEREVKKTA